MDGMNMTAQQQKRAAYALNMCTVSVSQIIDYNDVNILDQEYDAILNNLNLEEMPKDDALLKVLKDLLDVINYFKISELDKQFIEKEYQQKMKNAIWNAVPNFGMLIAGGSPLTMALSLANQVGIGYMNYRKSKNDYGMERDRQLWQLKRAAMEQFNYIRKELFDCSWRLADTYKFPDAFRLTEKQIAQYDSILLDQDVQRKYERLESVKGSFEAYPPFWYFIGNAANSIANDQTISISDATRKSFRAKALEYFDKFEQIEQNSILREDLLSASCALEHIDIMLIEGDRDFAKIHELLTKAVRMSGNAFDILQLCAITYLKIGEQDDAASILRKLVNEGYNTTINAQMLSAIYVHSFTKYRADYETLATRVNPMYLFPAPENDSVDVRFLESSFENKRRDLVNREVSATLDNYIQEYAVKWNSILSVFDENREYPKEFFLDNSVARMKRKNEAESLFGSTSLRENYQNRIVNCSFEPNIRRILNEFIDNLFEVGLFSSRSLQEQVENSVRQNIVANRETINSIQRAITSKSFQLSDYTFSQAFTIESVVGEACRILRDYASQEICRADANGINKIESDLVYFCTKMKIPSPEIAISENTGTSGKTSASRDRFSPELFGHQAQVDQKNADYLDAMVKFVDDRIEKLGQIGQDVSLYQRNTAQFNGYFRDTGFSGDPSIEAHSILILHDNTKKDLDLIFTTDGIAAVKHGKVNFLTPYDEVILKNDKIELFDRTYENKGIDKLALIDLISALSNKFKRGLDDQVEYIPGNLTIQILLNWFKSRSDAMRPEVTRVIVSPTASNMASFGYPIRKDMDIQTCMMQCYYDSSTKDVLGMRIVRAEGVDSKLQSLVYEKNGILKVGL